MIRFQVALRSPFGMTFLTAISAPAVLCREGRNAYSLFFNGLTQCSMTEIRLSMYYMSFLSIPFPRSCCTCLLEGDVQ